MAAVALLGTTGSGTNPTQTTGTGGASTIDANQALAPLAGITPKLTINSTK